MVDSTERAVVGKITGAYGVRGWIKIFPLTEERKTVLNFPDWFLEKNLQERSVRLKQGKLHGKYVVAQLEGVESREDAEALKGFKVRVDRAQFRKLEEDEYYWADLIGLIVRTGSGVELGKVISLMETGSNDVLVIKGDRERLVPFILGEVIKEVDIEGGEMVVDWDLEF